MNDDEIRILKLTRIGRETIFKKGTYDLASKAKWITQDHPFYAPIDAQLLQEPGESTGSQNSVRSDGVQAAPPSDDELAKQIMSSNFKSGLSQEEVDMLLAGLL